MERNYTPLAIAPRKIDTISLVNAEYSKDVRGRVAALVMPLAHQSPDYTNEWLFEIDWNTAGDRLHKRVSNTIYKSCKVRLPADMLNAIADMAAKERERTLHFDVTRRFQWSPGEFGDKGSCYWQSYKNARITYLPKMGAVAVRLYTKRGEGDYTGAGRFWLMPLPSIGEPHTSRVVAFNFYGGFQNGENVPELALHILGEEWVHYRKNMISMTAEGCYVNDSQAHVFYRKGTEPNTEPINIKFDQMLASTLALPKWGGNEPDYDPDDE